MKKETILEFVEEEIVKVNRNNKMFMYDYAYVNGLIDMAYMTKLIDRIEKNELKERIELNNLGKQGEQLFAQRMEQQGYIVEDVSANDQYFSKDIDFLITSPTTGQIKSFEVKWDQKINRTGNLYLEFVNVNSEQCLGWWEFCKADYLAYGNAKGKTFLVIEMNKLRERFEQLPKRVATRDDSAGYLVHISQIKDLIQTI